MYIEVGLGMNALKVIDGLEDPVEVILPGTPCYASRQKPRFFQKIRHHGRTCVYRGASSENEHSNLFRGFVRERSTLTQELKEYRFEPLVFLSSDFPYLQIRFRSPGL